MHKLLQSTSWTPSGIQVTWKDGKKHLFHFIWLRDNCRCSDCGDPSVGRRQLRLTDLDLHINTKKITCIENSKLKIVWPDEHVSLFSSDWLREHAYSTDFKTEHCFEPRLWDDDYRKEILPIPYDTVNKDDSGLFDALTQVQHTGLCFIEDSPPKPGILESLANRIGPIQESNFGRVQDLILDYRKRSVANRGIALKPHTDEPYRASPPGLLMFHCITTDIAGQGNSIFLDGFEISEQLKKEDPDGFNCLVQHPQNFRRHFQDDVDLIAEFPVIKVDSMDRVCGVRINDRVAGPAQIPPSAVTTYYRAMKRLLELSEDSNRWLRKRLRPGDIAIFDNHRILHGRTDLTINSKRWLQWVQVNRGDFYSKLRILTNRLNVSKRMVHA